MSEELKTEVMETTEAPQVTETMEDYAAELEASFKAFDEKQNRAFIEEEIPNAEAWQAVEQMKEDRTVVKVKIKEAVKGGVVAYVEELKAFIPASQLSVAYVEKLEDWVGRYVEAYVITVDPESKRLVLSAKELERERQQEEKNRKMESYKAGDVAEGTVESLKDYGAFVALEDGVTGLLHISQISSQRIKHPGVVLKEGQQVKVKILSVSDGKISLSMKALEQEETEEPVAFDYQGDGEISTGLGNLLKGLKF